jgi:site-specific recombinase XerD
MKAVSLAVITGTAAARYDRALFRAKDGRLPAGHPRPLPTAAWPPENVALLERYRDWLVSGGLSAMVINQLYIPTAGHVLGFQLKPHPQLDLDADLQYVLDYVRAKRLSAIWLKNTRVALAKFRQFLRQERGQWKPPLRLGPPGRARYGLGLPEWLAEQLERYQHLMQSHWRAARRDQQIIRFWNGHTRVWHWLLARHSINALTDLKRQYLFDYADARLTEGYAASTINNDLRNFRAFLLFLQDQDYRVPQALLRVPCLKEPERLPRYLTDEQVRQVRDEVERHLQEARFPAQRRDALLDRAAFYLMWHSGLRLGEVEELRLDDLDLLGKKLMIRRGKGQKDRAVYLTTTAVRAVQAYLAVRGEGLSDHLFLYRHRAVSKDLIGARVRAAGKRAGVQVTPHQLRHTCATQLLNAGCRVTSIQKLLGHRSLDTTMIYARVHDRSLADDYYAAMERIEQALNVSGEADAPDAKHTQVLELVNRLAEPQLDIEQRLALVAQLRSALA